MGTEQEDRPFYAITEEGPKRIGVIEGEVTTKGDGWAALDEVERRTKDYHDLVSACIASLQITGNVAWEEERTLAGAKFALSMVLWFIEEVRREGGA